MPYYVIKPDNNTLILALVSITILLLLLIVVGVLFSVFIRRKNELLIEQQDSQKRFEREIAESQIEIREETLRNISWELHDNIGQLLTLAKIQTQNSGGDQKQLDEAASTIGKGLTEIRALSRLINPEALKNMTLVEALELELDRFTRMEYLTTSLNVTGTPITIDKKIGSIIFRDEENLISNSSMEPHAFYSAHIAPYKGKLEMWYQEHKSTFVDISLIFLTAWVIIFSKSELPYKMFSDLPKRPKELTTA